MPEDNKPYDRDVDIYGIPRWFSFVLTGGPVEFGSESGPLSSEGRTSSFDWPFPQHIRIAHYLRRLARNSDFEGDDA